MKMRVSFVIDFWSFLFEFSNRIVRDWRSARDYFVGVRRFWVIAEAIAWLSFGSFFFIWASYFRYVR